VHLSASAIVLRRLMSANALLLEIVTGLYDQQASRWAAPTAPSAKWHLWHVARWSDIVQSTLFPIANNESGLSNKGTELWIALGIVDEWSFETPMPSKLGDGTGTGNAESSKLPLSDMIRIVGYARSSFELCEMRFSQIDGVIF